MYQAEGKIGDVIQKFERKKLPEITEPTVLNIRV